MFNQKLTFSPKQLERLHKLSAEATQKQQRLEGKLKNLPPHPQTGDIFLFDNPKTIGLQWVVLFPHPFEKEWLLTVPADDNPMTSSTDVAISQKALCGPLTLRCGSEQGLWIHKNDFHKKLRVGILEEWHLQRAFEKVEQIREGKLKSTAWEAENAADPEYEEWMVRVTQGKKALMQKSSLALPVLMPLSEWFKDKYVKAIKEGQLMLENLFSATISVSNSAFAFKSAPVSPVSLKMLKPVNLGEQQTVKLVVEIEQQPEQKLKVILRVRPTSEKMFLPVGLKLMLIPESGSSLEKEAENQKKELNYQLKGSPGERFQVKIAQGNAHFTERFVM
jgi:hypothetical protein